MCSILAHSKKNGLTSFCFMEAGLRDPISPFVKIKSSGKVFYRLAR